MREQDGPEKPSRRQLIVDIAHVVTAMSAVAAVVFTVVFTSKANDTAEGSLGVAREAQEQAQSAAEKALALKFYIGGIPPGESQGEDVSELGVINASAVDMYDVTVFGRGPAPVEPGGNLFDQGFVVPGSIQLEPFHACTGYTLPADFEVTNVLFFDGSTHWVRFPDGRLEKPGGSDSRRFSSEDEPEPESGIRDLLGGEPYEATTESRAFDVKSCS